MVFGCCTHHCRAADIDIFNGIFKTAIFICGHRFERVQINDDEINGRDVLRLHNSLILLATENTAVNARMQCFDTAIHDFGKTGVFADAGYGETCF